MKKAILTVIIFLTTLMFMFAQPEGFKYQGLARNSTGEALENQSISLRLSILEDNNGDCNGNLLYREKQVVTTNDLGLFWVTMGNPVEVLDGDFTSINWGGIKPLSSG